MPKPPITASRTASRLPISIAMRGCTPAARNASSNALRVVDPGSRMIKSSSANSARRTLSRPASRWSLRTKITTGCDPFGIAVF